MNEVNDVNCVVIFLTIEDEEMNNSKLIELVLNALPYSNQINDIDMTEDSAVRFTWRRNRFRISSTLHVEEVDGGLLAGSNIAIMFEALLKRAKALGEI
jgi:hypothetical protein